LTCKSIVIKMQRYIITLLVVLSIIQTIYAGTSCGNGQCVTCYYSGASVSCSGRICRKCCGNVCTTDGSQPIERTPAPAPPTTTKAPTPRPTNGCACPSGQTCCANSNQCYNVGSLSCTVDNYGTKVLCSLGQAACNGACYLPNFYTCSSTGVVLK